MRKGKKSNIQEIRGGLGGGGVGERRRGSRQVGGHGGGEEKDTIVSTAGTDGERNCAGSVGDQRRVTPEHPSNPGRGAWGRRAGSMSGAVGFTISRAPGHGPRTRAAGPGWSNGRGRDACARRTEREAGGGRQGPASTDPQVGPGRREVQALLGAQPCRESL